MNLNAAVFCSWFQLQREQISFSQFRNTVFPVLKRCPCPDRLVVTA